jgi:DNA-directed RNA polymerase specialized sigma24 family protein
VGKEALVEDHPFPEEWDAEQESITNVLPVAVMVEALARLMSMPAKTRDLVCRRYQGESYASIARAENMSVSAVEVRHKRALATWPELRELFAVKCAKQVRRQAKKRRQQAGLRAGCRALRP